MKLFFKITKSTEPVIKTEVVINQISPENIQFSTNSMVLTTDSLPDSFLWEPTKGWCEEWKPGIVMITAKREQDRRKCTQQTSINTIYLFENLHEILKLEVEISGRPHRSVRKLW